EDGEQRGMLASNEERLAAGDQRQVARKASRRRGDLDGWRRIETCPVRAVAHDGVVASIAEEHQTIVILHSEVSVGLAGPADDLWRPRRHTVCGEAIAEQIARDVVGDIKPAAIAADADVAGGGAGAWRRAEQCQRPGERIE